MDQVTRFLQSNTPIYLTSVAYLIWMKPNWVHLGKLGEVPPQPFALFGAVFAVLIGERLASRYQWAQRFSINTFLHEGTHWIAAKGFGLDPSWRLGQTYTAFWGRPKRAWQNSVLSLSPMAIWLSGLIFAVCFVPSSHPLLSTFAIFLMVLTTEIGTPSDDGSWECDWATARRHGNALVNMAFIFAGVLLVLFALIRFA